MQQASINGLERTVPSASTQHSQKGVPANHVGVHMEVDVDITAFSVRWLDCNHMEPHHPKTHISYLLHTTVCTRRALKCTLSRAHFHLP